MAVKMEAMLKSLFVICICLVSCHGGAITTADEKEPPMFEGDILVTKQLLSEIGELRNGTKKGIGLFDALKRGQWPRGIVPYTIAEGHEKRLQKSITKAIAIYNKALGKCVQWKYYTMDTIRRKKMKNYIQFFQGRGCYSSLGRQTNGAQQISLQVPGCTTKVGTTVHEMMHALGFFHEQSRRDRDKYISINWGNIDPKARYNFEKYRSGQATTFGAPYDIGSVMHYGNYAFAVNRNRQTITAKKGRDVLLGQREGLSKVDIQQLRKYYKCKGKAGPNSGAVTRNKKKTCTDQFSRCYLKRKTCDEPTVQKYCKKTCGLCGKKKKTSKCTDNTKYAKKCAMYKRKGYCVSGNRYYYWVTKRCQKTCRKC